MGNLLHMANYELAKRLMATLSLGKSVTSQIVGVGTRYRVSQNTWEFSDELYIVFAMN